ncbi:hypothetical protein ABEB36_000075 [Hypothenemus hampei]|uniref:Transcription factor Adf-1 n=1 Tax=Hypothenemus hampei TaxID=57062 RepID=A0ABD1FA69_HYPHA
MSQKFTHADDEVLINHVREFPCIYDHENKDFKDYQIRENVWNQIGVVLSKSSDECKLRWKNIRDNYLKNKRKQKQGTGSAASSRPTKWPLFEHLKFLELVKSERRRIHNFKENENDRNSQSEVFVDDASESGSQNIRDIESDNIASPESVEFNIPSKRAKPNIDTSRSNSPSLSGHLHTPSTSARSKLLNTLEERSKQRMEMLSKLTDQKEDDVDLFMRSMALMVKKLPLNLINEAKFKILTVVTNLQTSIDIPQQPQISTSSFPTFSTHSHNLLNTTGQMPYSPFTSNSEPQAEGTESVNTLQPSTSAEVVPQYNTSGKYFEL